MSNKKITDIKFKIRSESILAESWVGPWALQFGCHKMAHHPLLGLKKMMVGKRKGHCQP